MPEKIRPIIAALKAELETKEPSQTEWSNFGKLNRIADCYHCHLNICRHMWPAGRFWT